MALHWRFRRPSLRVRTLMIAIAGFALLLWGGIVLLSPTRWLEYRLRPESPAYARNDAAAALGYSRWIPPWEIDRAVSALIRTLDDRNAMVRVRAVMSIGERPRAANRAWPEIIDRLDDESGDVRAVTAAVLGKLADVPSDPRVRAAAVPALIACLDDPSPFVRLNAATSLYTLGRPEDSVPGLVTNMTDPNDFTRGSALHHFRRYGLTPPKGLSPALFDIAVRDGDPARRLWAIEALEQLAPRSEFRRMLPALADDEDPEVSRYVEARLEAMPGPVPDHYDR